MNLKAIHILSLACAVGSARAEFTYIDATLTNTTLAGAPFSLDPPANYSESAGSSDNLWSYRALSSFEGGFYFETDSGTPNEGNGESNDRETTPDLITTITLPTAGSYEIVAIFSNNQGLRDIAARIGESPSNADLFNRDNSFNADQSLASPAIDFDSTYTNGRTNTASAAAVGIVTTTSDNEEVSVFINGLASTDEIDDERTRYDGLGYELIVSSPPSEPVHHDVFIIAGQSNGDGRGLASELTGSLSEFSGVQSDAIIYYSNPGRYGDTSDPNYLAWVPLEPGYSVAPGEAGPLPTNSFGHEIGAATVLAEEFENIAFIKVTEGGTSLGQDGEDWHPPVPPADVGRLYTDLITVVPAALQTLTDRGDTFTVHALYWHQGESDGNRRSSYPTLFNDFVESVREDLDIPNLRIVIGALAPERDPDFLFRDLQWDLSRDIRNASFTSSINLTTTDDTHFDTSSVVEMGLRLGEALARQGRILSFPESGFGTGILDRQGDFSAVPEIEVLTTTNSGDYVGGLAIGNSSVAGPHSANLRRVLPLAQARALRASFFVEENDSSLLVAGWEQDPNNDDIFSVDETGLGIGLSSNGLFRIFDGSSEALSTGISYQSNQWYELLATWSAPNTNGESVVNLFVTNLTTSTNLNGGEAVATLTTEITPTTWLGTGILIDGGFIDDIGVEDAGFNGWVENRFPTLTSGPNGDDDGDGLANAFEYAYGLDPFVFNSRDDSPNLTLSGNDVTLSIPKLPRTEDALVEVLQSTDLSIWEKSIGVDTSSSRDFTFSTETTPRLFFSKSLEIRE